MTIPAIILFMVLMGASLVILAVRYKPSIPSGRPKALAAGVIILLGAIIMLFKYFRGDY